MLSGHNGWVSDAALSHDGKRCVTVSGDGTARVWDTASGRCERQLEGHSGEVRCVALTSRARFAVTGSSDTTAEVWDLLAPPLPLPQHHTGKVGCARACARAGRPAGWT